MDFQYGYLNFPNEWTKNMRIYHKIKYLLKEHLTVLISDVNLVKGYPYTLLATIINHFTPFVFGVNLGDPLLTVLQYLEKNIFPLLLPVSYPFALTNVNYGATYNVMTDNLETMLTKSSVKM